MGEVQRNEFLPMDNGLMMPPQDAAHKGDGGRGNRDYL